MTLMTLEEAVESLAARLRSVEVGLAHIQTTELPALNARLERLENFLNDSIEAKRMWDQMANPK